MKDTTNTKDAIELPVSLRDYFAAKAMQGLFSNNQCPLNKQEVADASYEIANLMIEAREK